MTMPPSRAQPARASIVSINLLIGLLFALISLAAMLWLGGMTAALVSGHPAPHASMLAGLRMLAHPGNPRLAWHSAMPGPAWYWTCTGVVIGSCRSAGLPRHPLVSAHRIWEQRPSSTHPRTRRASRHHARGIDAHRHPPRGDRPPDAHQAAARAGRLPARPRPRRRRVGLRRGLHGHPRAAPLRQRPAPGHPHDPRRTRTGDHHQHPPRQPRHHPRRPGQPRPGRDLRPAAARPRPAHRPPGGHRCADATSRRPP